MSAEQPEQNYVIKSSLVHILIAAIIAAIISIGGYMIAWAINDAAWKAALSERITELERKVAAIKMIFNSGMVQSHDERIRQIERRQEETDRRQERLHSK